VAVYLRHRNCPDTVVSPNGKWKRIVGYGSNLTIICCYSALNLRYLQKFIQINYVTTAAGAVMVASIIYYFTVVVAVWMLPLHLWLSR
jgi:hypothetical protein